MTPRDRIQAGIEAAAIVAATPAVALVLATGWGIAGATAGVVVTVVGAGGYARHCARLALRGRA
jgi:hypothetical protein